MRNLQAHRAIAILLAALKVKLVLFPPAMNHFQGSIEMFFSVVPLFSPNDLHFLLLRLCTAIFI